MDKAYRNDPYPIRLPADLRQYLKQKADEGDRSLHKEILRRLEQSRKHEELHHG